VRLDAHVSVGRALVRGLPVTLLHADLNDQATHNWIGGLDFEVCLMLAILHKLRDPAALIRTVARRQPELIVVRLPPKTAPVIIDKRSGNRPCNVEANGKTTVTRSPTSSAVILRNGVDTSVVPLEVRVRDTVDPHLIEYYREVSAAGHAVPGPLAPAARKERSAADSSDRRAHAPRLRLRPGSPVLGGEAARRLGRAAADAV
jgi:hypothetical protein